MQTLKIKKGKLRDEVLIPSSKSYANRALIMASLLKKPPKLKNLPSATDVSILLDCLKEMGLNYEVRGDELIFLNSFPDCETRQTIELSVGEGGTTARFLATMCLLGSSTYHLILGERLKERPWDSFILMARSLGATISLIDNRLSIKGSIQFPDELKIDCKKTTQFATAFQLLTVSKKLQVIPVNMTSSKSYWAMTEKMVKDLVQTKVFDIPKDWSSASYPLAFGALNQQMRFPGLKLDPLQADAKFVDLLLSFECLEVMKDSINVKPLEKHRPVKFDVSDCLDLVPTLGYFLAHIEGDHQLMGVGNLVHKESDRLTEVIKLLGHFNRRAWSEGANLYIQGTREMIMKAPRLLMPNDHRMVMAATLFLLHHSGGELAPEEAVLKSYPGFFELIE
jgi:3-phosphoshikimate 1-carboxyvinyltransferase